MFCTDVTIPFFAGQEEKTRGVVESLLDHEPSLYSTNNSYNRNTSRFGPILEFKQWIVETLWSIQFTGEVRNKGVPFYPINILFYVSDILVYLERCIFRGLFIISNDNLCYFSFVNY